MEKIDITKLQGNQVGEDSIPYNDIEVIAEKVNEIINYINSPSTRVE